MAKTRFKMTSNFREPGFDKLPTLAPLAPGATDDPAEVFLRLCSYTVPFGGEDTYYGALLKAEGFRSTGLGNYALEVPLPDGGAPSTCFMAHLDTASWSCVPISRFVDGNNVCGTDGNSILGADDRAGVALLLYLAAEKVPGLYYLFVGEEDGRIGSGRLSKMGGLPEYINKAVSFDRKGQNSVITHQLGQRCCSKEFAETLCEELNQYGLEYSPDPSGVYTDSIEFTGTCRECTNISVGYEGAHSTKETQDLGFLAYLCKVCAAIDWEALPAVREPNEYDYDDDGHGYYDPKDWDWVEDRPISASEGLFYSKDAKAQAENDAYQAIEELADNFQQGLPVDRNAVWKLLNFKSVKDQVDMVEMLIDELQRAQWNG